MKKITNFILNNPKKIIAAIFIITIFFAYYLPKLQINSDMETMLPENSSVVSAIRKIDKQFGGVAYVIALIESDDVFTEHTLEKIDKLTLGMKEIPDVNEVLSITRMDEIKGTEMGIEVSPVLSSVPHTKTELETFRKYVLSDKRYRGIFVSTDGRYSIIIGKLSTNIDESPITKKIQELVDKNSGPEKIYLIGSPFITKALQENLVKDLRILLPITAFVIILVLFFSFRSFSGIFLPLLTVALSTIWAMGAMALVKEPMTLITTILPVILFTVGTAYPIHIIARYYEEIANGFLKREALEKVISQTGIPVFLAAITTVFGFSSNLFTRLRPIKVFAIVGTFGVLLAFIFALTLVPIFLMWMPTPKIKKQEQKKDSIFVSFLKFLSDFVSKNRVWIVVGTIAIVAFFAAGIPRIVTESNFVEYFRKGSNIKIGHNIVDEKFGGSFNMNITVTGDILAPSVMKQIDTFEQGLKNLNNVNYPQSITDILKDTNKALHEGDEHYYALPDSREAASQYMLLISMSNSSFLNNLITPDYRQVNITARLDTVRTATLIRVIKEVQTLADKCFTNEVKVEISGSPFLINEIQKLLISSQYSSLIMAFISVFIIITLIYRTRTSGIFALMPIFVTVIAMLGTMGWCNIPLDMANALCGSIAIGIGIDYSCHFFARYKEERKKGLGRTEGVRETVLTVGGPIFFNAIAVGAGFLVLSFSSFPVLGMFGKLIAFAMVFSSLGSLIIIPTLILIKARVKGDR